MRAANGAIAIYTVPSLTATDDSPLTSPRNNLSRLKFHSGLRYPAVIDTRVVTLSLPDVGASTERNVVHTLFAHGQSGTPGVFGMVQFGSNWSPLLSSTIVQTASVGSFGGLPAQPDTFRTVALGATASNITVHEYGRSLTAVGFPALALTITVYITDEVL